MGGRRTINAHIIINEPPVTAGNIFASYPTGIATGAVAAGAFQVGLGTYNTFIKNYYQYGGFVADIVTGNNILNAAEGVMGGFETSATTSGLNCFSGLRNICL